MALYISVSSALVPLKLPIWKALHLRYPVKLPTLPPWLLGLPIWLCKLAGTTVFFWATMKCTLLLAK
jgi:hypothetical protein